MVNDVMASSYLLMIVGFLIFLLLMVICLIFLHVNRSRTHENYECQLNTQECISDEDNSTFRKPVKTPTKDNVINTQLLELNKLRQRWKLLKRE